MIAMTMSNADAGPDALTVNLGVLLDHGTTETAMDLDVQRSAVGESSTPVIEVSYGAQIALGEAAQQVAKVDTLLLVPMTGPIRPGWRSRLPAPALPR